MGGLAACSRGGRVETGAGSTMAASSGAVNRSCQLHRDSFPAFLCLHSQQYVQSSRSGVARGVVVFSSRCQAENANVVGRPRGRRVPSPCRKWKPLKARHVTMRRLHLCLPPHFSAFTHLCPKIKLRVRGLSHVESITSPYKDSNETEVRITVPSFIVPKSHDTSASSHALPAHHRIA